jgi:hypothetical protein
LLDHQPASGHSAQVGEVNAGLRSGDAEAELEQCEHRDEHARGIRIGGKISSTLRAGNTANASSRP